MSSLNLVPEKFLPEASNIKDSLLARGKGFWSLQGQQYREYTGETYTLHTNEEATRVMVSIFRCLHYPLRCILEDVQQVSLGWKDLLGISDRI